MTCKKLEHGPSGDQALPERALWINIFKYKYKYIVMEISGAWRAILWFVLCDTLLY